LTSRELATGTPGPITVTTEVVSQGRTLNTDQELAREAVDVIRAEIERYERPAELGPLELTMTPVGRFDRVVVDYQDERDVDRLVLLPQPDAPRNRRHEPVPIDEILHTIDRLAATVRHP
jgi:hypothetical protein